MPQQPIAPNTLNRMSGAPPVDNQNGLPANPRPPLSLHDYRFVEKATHFDLKPILQLTQQELQAADTTTVLRPLGSFEEFFWLIDQNRPLHFALAAQVQGPTTVGRWRDALDLVQRRHPLL
jgi:hypothetical protein